MKRVIRDNENVFIRAGIYLDDSDNIKFNWNSDTDDAVSYTHLDVYKRQVLGRGVYQRVPVRIMEAKHEPVQPLSLIHI